MLLGVWLNGSFPFQPGLFGRGLGLLAHHSYYLFLIVTTSKLKVFSLLYSPPRPTPTLHFLVTLQLCEEDCFSNISVKVSYQLQTPKGQRDHLHPVLDLYSEPSAIFQVILPTARTRPSWEPFPKKHLLL